MKRPKGQQKNPARVFWACWPSTLLSILCFLFFTKHCFSPENGLFCSFLSVSLSFSLVLSLFLFHSLSLSILFLVFFLFFPCFLVDFLLVFLLFCLPCFFVFVSRQNFTFERFFFINYFCFLGFPVLFCLSKPFS